MSQRTVTFLACTAFSVALAGAPPAAQSTMWYVAAGAHGNGAATAPFGHIQDALAAARAGDTVVVRAGVYRESLRTVTAGEPGAPIRVRAEQGRGSVLVTYPGRVLRVDHPHTVVQGLVLDAQYAAADAVTVGTGADFLTLFDVEVRRSSRDLIDIGDARGVLIDGSLIHHALNAAGGRTDAHGIAAGAVRNLIIRETEIHTFSGDGLQVDPGRSSPGWNDVTLERSRIWIAPLGAPENGFPAGVVPGENAVDTKAGASFARASMVITDVTASGFRNGLIGNMAAFNLKENVAVRVDRVTVHDSEIAFRVRGPSPANAPGAWVTVSNGVIYDTDTAYRYENDIERLSIWNGTIGRSVTRVLRAASSNARGLDLRNLLVLGPMPPEAALASNRSVTAAEFVDASADDYALAPDASVIDAGVRIPEVASDRDGTRRPQGRAYDIGAYEMSSPRR